MCKVLTGEGPEEVNDGTWITGNITQEIMFGPGLPWEYSLQPDEVGSQ